MNMQNKKKSSPVALILATIVGVVLMVGGFWFSKNVHIEFMDKLAEQGIPLDLGKTVSTIGVFLILFPLINMFFIKPLRESIDGRNNELETTFAEAENLKSRMAELKSDYESRLTQSEAVAREQIQKAVSEAGEMRAQMLAEAKSQADAIKATASAEMARERDKTLVELRKHVVDMTLVATERIIGESMDKERQRKLVEDFISTAEVGR